MASIKEIAIQVKKLRQLAGYTQKELADLAGIGKTAVFDIEKGKETVQLKTLMAVFKVLNIKIEIISPIKERY